MRLCAAVPDIIVNGLLELNQVGLLPATTPRRPNPIPRIIVTTMANVIDQAKITIKTSDYLLALA